MIYKIYNKWQLTSVIVNFADKSTPVWKIPFPAITICPETKTLKSDVDFSYGFRMAKKGFKENLTNNEMQRIEALAQVCEAHLFNFSMNSGLSIKNIVPMLESLALPRSEAILYCTMDHDYVNCDEHFQKIITDEGICYTYNMLNASEIFDTEK